MAIDVVYVTEEFPLYMQPRLLGIIIIIGPLRIIMNKLERKGVVFWISTVTS